MQFFSFYQEKKNLFLIYFLRLCMGQQEVLTVHAFSVLSCKKANHEQLSVVKPRELMTYVSSEKQSRVVFFRRRLIWISAKYFILYLKIIHQRGSEWYLANHHRASQSVCAKSTCVVYTKYYYFNLFRVMAALQGTQSVDPLCGLYEHV